ncbi:GAG-pre-integrase domain-containing protein, partial [Klebsiella pneumoniae]|uniref:GAG-pre-integrase domain-containing protein n=1 Tax=Klebsiella pneumoniae TaxID=573 RepID=UPI003A80AB64
FSSPKFVKVADGNMSPIVGIGDIQLSPTLWLKKVVYAPKFPRNLMSVSRLTSYSNCRIIFNSGMCWFQDLLTGKTIGGGHEQDGMYYLSKFEASASLVESPSSILKWHCRLGHLPPDKLHCILTSIPTASVIECEGCQLGKHTRVSFPSSQSQSSSKPFDLLHVDVWGPSKVPSRSRHKYYVVLVDDYSRVSWVFLLRERSEVICILKTFIL